MLLGCPVQQWLMSLLYALLMCQAGSAKENANTKGLDAYESPRATTAASMNCQPCTYACSKRSAVYAGSQPGAHAIRSTLDFSSLIPIGTRAPAAVALSASYVCLNGSGKAASPCNHRTVLRWYPTCIYTVTATTAVSKQQQHSVP